MQQKRETAWERELRELNTQAAMDIGVLMGACVDYRNTLGRGCVADPVSNRQGGVNTIFKKYGVELKRDVRHPHATQYPIYTADI